MEIYEDHMKNCTNPANVLRRTSINKYGEWKNLEKRNVALTKLVSQFPAFTKLYKENVLLKQEKKRVDEMPTISQFDKLLPTRRTAE